LEALFYDKRHGPGERGAKPPQSGQDSKNVQGWNGLTLDRRITGKGDNKRVNKVGVLGKRTEMAEEGEPNAHRGTRRIGQGEGKNIELCANHAASPEEQEGHSGSRPSSIKSRPRGKEGVGSFSPRKSRLTREGKEAERRNKRQKRKEHGIDTTTLAMILSEVPEGQEGAGTKRRALIRLAIGKQKASNLL